MPRTTPVSFPIKATLVQVTLRAPALKRVAATRLLPIYQMRRRFRCVANRRDAADVILIKALKSPATVGRAHNQRPDAQ